MSRYLMGVAALVAMFAAATSEASAQLLENLNDLLLGPLRSSPSETATENTIPLEEAGRLVQRQAPVEPGTGIGVTGDAIPDQENTIPVDPNQPTITPTPTVQVAPGTPAAPETGDAPDSIPALW